jgi:hypothetical protein
MKRIVGLGFHKHEQLKENEGPAPSHVFIDSKRTGGDGKLNVFAGAFSKIRPRPFDKQHLVPLRQRLATEHPAFVPGVSLVELNDVPVNEKVDEALGDLYGSGRLVGDEKPKIEDLSLAQQDFLASEQGMRALREANRPGNKVDWKAFLAIPDSLLVASPRLPNPLFHLATSGASDGLDAEQREHALDNALKCNLFDVSKTDHEGRNPIHVAATHGNAQAINAFIARDVAAHPDDPKKRALNAKTKDGRTALKNAVTCGLKTAPVITQALIDGGARLATSAKKQRMVRRAEESGNDELKQVVASAFGTKQRGATLDASIRELIQSGLLSEAEVPAVRALSPAHQAYLLSPEGKDWLWEVKERGHSFNWERFASIGPDAIPIH